MCSVGSGMVLAIGDLAGATFVTLLAATAMQFARAGRLWTMDDRDRSCHAAGLVGNAPRHRRPYRHPSPASEPRRSASGVEPRGCWGASPAAGSSPPTRTGG